MENNLLLSEFTSQSAQKELEVLMEKPGADIVQVKGLYGSSKSFALAGAAEKGVTVVIMDNKEEAQFFTNDLYNLLQEENVFFFPTSSNLVSNKINTIKDSSQKVQRSAAISALNGFITGKNKEKQIILVAYPASVFEKIPNNRVLKKNMLTIKKGEMVTHEFIKETLQEYKLEKVDFVGEPGQFALRGSIIDVFSFSSDKPYRIDFFGNEVESIREFDTNTQRSLQEKEQVEIFPNIYEEELESGELVDVFEFVGKGKCRVWINDITVLQGEQYDSIRESIFANKVVSFNNIPGTNVESVEFRISPQPSFNKNFGLLLSDIDNKIKEGYTIYISSENERQFERLRNIFSHNGEERGYNVPKFTELLCSIHTGFVDTITKTCLYTDHQIFDRYHRVKIKREVPRSERLTLNELSAFQIGDYIVHIDHGVGIFGGLVKTNLNGKVQEAIKLIYKDNDVIFVSIHGIHRISRYKSKESTPPKIYKLGTGAWDKLKTQTKNKVKDIAKDLIKLYAERRQAKGFAFSPDSYLQHELEASFMYEDTPDQLKTTHAVKEDMERDYPMDRLVCGDVGFGKTEIAVRAAFKAAVDGKQVALLVPTTILALQHYKTFSKRLKDFPCNIEYISRLKTAKEIRQISENIKSGKTDIVIGTHRLLNKEIQFKDLGLLIIDEEQKFGVAAKERLRQLKLSVDTLTLTATPIPRTLQFSLLGARDLSIINTPPPNRLPVQTEIIDFNEDIIRDTINYELERGGQVYFVHNRVEDILAVEDIIKRICPGIKTCVGHGQMDPKELEGKILDFMAGDYDILIATTIVENGIDIPNANTIIINQAQNFGLSDLHQLRGRVGRSNQKAFCYLIVPSMASITDDARRRLRAIEAFSDLGSGFNIAMQDLDIRGAGNLLGGEQSGFIADMGFETYQRILAEAFMEIKQEEGVAGKDLKEAKKGIKNEQMYRDALQQSTVQDYVTDCTIDTDMELLIPDSYISITSEKIRLYKELDAISTQEALDKFVEDLRDRFGELPEQLVQLTYVVRLRREAISLGFERIVLKNNVMLAYFVANQQSPYYSSPLFASILNYINAAHGNMQVSEQNKKLLLKIRGVNTIEKGYNIVFKMKMSIFAPL
ncbi:MAG: transcription-repair coupling factor [Bacteroidales bacterium]|nr:transcription-repair coupling factor [Bacteroidales bacterium]